MISDIIYTVLFCSVYLFIYHIINWLGFKIDYSAYLLGIIAAQAMIRFSQLPTTTTTITQNFYED